MSYWGVTRDRTLSGTGDSPDQIRRANCCVKRTRVRLQSADGKESGDEIEKPSKAGIGLFVAGRDAAECLERAEEVLDEVAPFVHFGVMGDASGPVGFGRDDGCCAAFVQVGAQPVVVEGLVADQRFKIEAGDQGSTPMLS